MDIKENKGQKGKKALPPLRLQDIGLPRLVLIALAGVVLLLLSFPSNRPGTSTRNKTDSVFQASSLEESGESSSDVEAYAEKKERQLEEILSKVQGVGAVEVMITLDLTEEKNEWGGKVQEGEVEGVLVVAQGAGEPDTDAEIIQAVQALFSLDLHKIRVMKME